MADRPWDAHHAADVEDLRRAIRAQFPDVPVEGLEHLGSGWEFDAYVTGDGWVFRFPRRQEAPAQLTREVRVLELVRSAMSPRVAAPEPVLWGEPGPHFPWPFAGHRMVEGVRADHPRVPARPALAREIAWALGRIHAIPPAEARAVGVELDREGCRAWREEARPAAAALRGLDATVDAAVEWLDGDPPLPDPYEGPDRFIHNDLCPDHVLVGRDTGALTGIIDWTDAALGDPVLDFIFLVTSRGWPFTEAVLAHYPIPLDPGFRLRLSFLARVLALVWLDEARERGAAVGKHVRWTANAFADTPPTGRCR